ncbi:MAG: polysaccharide biosynthesis protein, partial [Clostridia bacterium]|nr:polysaccharide biosynthesis protein [Clostridia bacterium]
IYTAMFTISTAALPVAVSKLVAESIALGRHREASRIGSVALSSFAAIGLLFSLAMIIFADGFVSFAKNSAVRESVIVVAPTIFFMCIVSAIRGYYQGRSNMVPTAISQVIEALGKLFFGRGLAYYFMHKGYGLEIVVAGAIGGVTIGTVLSTIYLVIVRCKDAKYDREEAALQSEEEPKTPYSTILKKLLTLSLPITIGASVLSLANLIDTFVVLRRLQDGCLMTDIAANHLYGVYGMESKLFNLPQTIIVSIGISVIPGISAALAVFEEKKARSLTESAFRLTSLLAFPCAVGLAVLSKPILSMLYYNKLADATEAAPLLIYLTPAVFLVAMVSVSNSVLQGSGKIWVPVVTVTVGGVIKLVTNYVLVGTPGINISGAPIGTCLCYGTIMILNLVYIRLKIVRFSPAKVFLKPLVASLVMGVFAWLIYSPLSAVFSGGFIQNSVAVLLTVGLSAVIYALMLIVLKALPKEDVLMLPKGKKIAALLKLD